MHILESEHIKSWKKVLENDKSDILIVSKKLRFSFISLENPG